MMLYWLRHRGSLVSAVTLITYVASMLPAGAAWASAPAPEQLPLDTAPPSLAAPSRHIEDTKAAVSAQLETQSDPGGVAPLPAVVAGTPDGRSASLDLAQASLGTTAPAQTVSPQAISLPSGAATMAGMGESFTAQLTTGIAAFNVPFGVPAGRAGLAPTLSLVYSSSGGYGLAGVGWSLAGPLSIARQSDRGLPGYDDRSDWYPEQDRFVFGGQELVPICTVSTGQCAGALAGEGMPPWAEGWQYFRARVEGAFLRFFWSPDHQTWRIQSKVGISFELGVPLDGSGYAASLERNPSNPNQIYRWHVVRQYDAHGDPDAVPPEPLNLVVFRYLQDGNLAYLSDVFYTPPASDPGTSDLATYAHHVALAYDVRSDRNVSYRSGWLLEQRIRLSRVDVTSKPFAGSTSAPRELVRRFHLEYEPATHASLLASVAMEGRCAEPIAEQGEQRLPATSCPRLPALSLEYQRVAASSAPPVDSQGFEFERFVTVVREVEGSPQHSLGSGASLSALIDVNSDGLPDVVTTSPVLSGGHHSVFFNRGEANGKLRFGSAERLTIEGVSGVDGGVLKLSNPNVTVLDLDGDATADLVHMPAVRRYSIFSPKRSGSQWLWQGRSVSTASGQDARINFAQDARRTAVMDVNGDGLVDVVFASATEYQTFFALGRYPGGDGQFGQARWTGAASADLSNDPVAACTPWSAAPVRLGDPDVRVGDLNGDGLPDIARVRSGQVLYWPGRGNGYWGTGDPQRCRAGEFGQDQHVLMGNAPRFGTTQPGTLEIGDVNGDGLADVVEIRADAVDVYLNDNGLGFADRQALSDVPQRSNTSTPVRLTDANGSGTVDLLWGMGHEYRYIDLTGGVRPYVLTKIHNGLGKTTELEYRSSTELMVAAADQGQPWASVMPLSTPVVVRTTVRDNLELVGRAPGRYVTEYTYRDPVFEGRQREFRGFRSTDVRHVGDAFSPTSTVRSTHRLGECEAAQSGFDVCSPAERWRDNWREPLKGLPVLTEIFDENGVYLATEHRSYELRQLYAGRDGRRVSVALPVGQDALRYDTSAFNAATSSVAMPEVDVQLDDIEQSESRSVIRRASAGTVRVQSTAAHDDFGNLTGATSSGCVEGCLASDEAITTHSTVERVPGDTSGWLWRPTVSFVTGSVHTAERRRVRHEYDARGDLERSFVLLSGTLPLDRFHESSDPVAPAPPDASGGVSAPVEIEIAALERDAFGNVIETRAPGGRCRSMAFDIEYADLPVEEVVFGGDIGQNGCGEREFVTQATYDRGLSLVLTSTSITEQPTLFDYDAFGRLVAETYADPDQPGQLASLPSVTYEYLLPSDWSSSPYSVLIVRAQDGATANDNAYHEQYHYADGLGRNLVVLSEADPSAGDGGDYVVGAASDYTAKGEPLRVFESRFWSGDPLAFPLTDAPPLRYGSQLYDSFGRVVQVYGLDGQLELVTVHHALGVDRWDAADIGPGPHAGSFASVQVDGHGRQVEAVERVRVNGMLEERHMLSDYLPTGELRRVIQRRAGSSDVVRWLRYDSLGRLVLNVEPNTSVDFDPDPDTDPSTLKAWRYAYNDSNQLVGTSDARGCGVNYHYDAAGRLAAEDYSPCRDHHAAYTSPNFAASTGIETLYRYDTADPEAATIEDAAERTLDIETSLLWGRAVSVSDLGSKSVVSYDARGRAIGIAKRVVKPGAPSSDLADRYAPRWYIQETTLDAAGRPLETSTGASSSELLGMDGRSVIQSEYTARGILKHTTSSYGALLDSRTVDANGLARSIRLGDAAATERTFSYDDQLRLRSVQTFRGVPELWTSPPQEYSAPDPVETGQLLLEDYDFEYDAADNVSKVTDWRTPDEWPESAKPVTRSFEYDDLYRLTRTTYEYAGGTDAWTSPFAAENASSNSVENEPRPSPHVDFDQRVLEQRYRYDHLGNTHTTTDNAHGFFDRSLGTISHGTAGAGPHRLESASNRAIAPTSPRQGDLDAGYDAAGNVADLIVRRDGSCLPLGASCWQRYHYEWDELGQLSRARRWDLSAASPNERDAHGDLEDDLPSRPADVELRYTYTAGGDRVLKTAVDPASNERHTVYIFGSLELRRSTFEGTGSEADYVLAASTENVLLGGGVSARVVYSEEDLPALMSGGRHVFLTMSDYLGSNTFVIDHATGELVEYATYQAYGSTESDYRPGRWGDYREPYKFTGKEEDVEVGLAYFGARYLSLGLGRWMSADPVTIHKVRSDPNPYAYVMGRPLVAIDPRGEELFTIIGIGIVVGALVAGGTSAGVQYATTGSIDWGWNGVGGAALAGAVGGGLSAGLGAAGAGIWAGAAGGAASSATGAAVNGAGGTEILVAAGLGGLGGLVGGAISTELNGLTMRGLEPTGIGLQAAVHMSAAGNSIVTGAGMGLAVEGLRDFGGANANYGQAAAIGAGTGAAGYAGAAVSGSLPNPGPSFDAPEGATRFGNWQNQARVNEGQLVREVGSVQYEWGGKYYSSGNVVSSSHDQIGEDEIFAGAWLPPGASISGITHAHTPPTELSRIYAEGPDESYRGFGGFHSGDKKSADSSWQARGRPPIWVEGISTPAGRLEFYYPRTGRSYEQPRLRGLPSLR